MANTLKFGNGEWYGKKDTILAYNDENSNYKPLPFDFSRASNATVVNKDGLIETVGSGQPRIDYKDHSEGALLLEPQRTNLITYSEDFSNSYWIKNGASVTSGFLSPDGTANAFKLVEDTSTGTHRIRISSLASGAAASKEFTYSFFVKKSEVKWFLLKGVVNTQSLTVDVWFDLENGVVGTESNGVGSIENYGNDWYRCSINIVTNSSATSINLYGYLSDDDNSESYQGDGTSGVYIYGAMVEQGSYATSLINTQGSAVTRLADICSQTVPDGVVGQIEGTIFVDLDLNESIGINTSAPIRFNLNNGVSTDNWVFIGIENGDNLRVYVRANASSSVDFIKDSVFSTNGNYKIAMSFKANKTVCYVNGVLQYNVDLGVVPNNLNSIGLGAGITGDAVSEKSQTKEFKLYNTALSNTELQALTS